MSFGPVSIGVRAGEIVGVAGAEGNGQRALLRGIIGIDRSGGSTTVAGKPMTRVTPASALASGISFQSGDRAAESIFAPLSVMANATVQLDQDARSARAWLSTAGSCRRSSAPRNSSESCRVPSPADQRPVGWQPAEGRARPPRAAKTPNVLIVDEPTQGVDAKARLDIYKVLADAADDGIAVLVNSSDSSELAGLCDRVYVDVPRQGHQGTHRAHD